MARILVQTRGSSLFILGLADVIPFPFLRFGLHSAAALLALAGAVSAAADLQLSLPESYQDAEPVAKKRDSGPCTTCGIVVSVRPGNPNLTRPQPRPQAIPAIDPAMVGGPGGPLVSVPLVGRGGDFKQQPEMQAPPPIYIITVRLDNGSYTAIEQEGEPLVHKGDRVQVNGGQIVPETP